MSTDTGALATCSALLTAAKERIAKYKPQNCVYEDILQPSLSAFIEWLPEGGRESVARDIVNTTTDKALYDVFHTVLTGLTVPMKARSRKPFIPDTEAMDATLDRLETCYTNFRNQCLQRDGYRCVVTGAMDTDHWESLDCPEDVYSGTVEAAHIIQFAYALWDKPSGPQDDTSHTWAVLWRCFPEVRKVGMKVKNINDLSNGLTLIEPFHTDFGKFALAFKPTESDNVYEIKTYRRFSTIYRRLLPENGRVEFTKAEDAKSLELPSAALFDCHYRLAEILNASGMAEVIEKHHREWEDIKVSVGCCPALGEPHTPPAFSPPP